MATYEELKARVEQQKQQEADDSVDFLNGMLAAFGFTEEDGWCRTPDGHGGIILTNAASPRCKLWIEVWTYPSGTHDLVTYYGKRIGRGRPETAEELFGEFVDSEQKAVVLPPHQPGPKGVWQRIIASLEYDPAPPDRV